MSRRIFRKLEILRNLKGFLGAYLMRVWLISVFKLVLKQGFSSYFAKLLPYLMIVPMSLKLEVFSEF